MRTKTRIKYFNHKNLNLDTLNGIADNIEEYFSNEEFLNNIKKKIYIRTI